MTMPTMPFWSFGSALRRSTALSPSTSCFRLVNTAIDPERCQKSWRTAWRKLTAVAGVKGFRFHDCRHHAITEMAESQASDSTIMALAGHVSRKMLEHYSHVRQEAKRDAVSVLSASRPCRPRMRGYDTNNDTKAAFGGRKPVYLVEKMVGTTGFEPATSPTPRVRSTRLSHVPTVRPLVYPEFRCRTNRWISRMRRHWRDSPHPRLC